METGVMAFRASCLVPGITFQGMRMPSWDSKSKNSAMARGSVRGTRESDGSSFGSTQMA